MFLHSGFSHLASNSLPLIFLMATLLIVYPKPAFPAMLFMVLYANILVWIFGRSAYHIGASGLVYSLVAFLIAAGYFKRRPLFAIIAFIIAVLYGGLVWGRNSRTRWMVCILGIASLRCNRWSIPRAFL
ncbi:MAG: rhomboid family intramembrane serine protease [Leptospiraceae bacterium]|nr:rhomboid family intramembrane serine protease [Leptospiraceae bacterium]